MGESPIPFVEVLRREWTVIKGAPWSFVSVCVVACTIIWGAIWWHYSGVIESKDATISQVRIALDLVKSENEKSVKQLFDFKTAHEELNSPLKQRITILANQLEAFAQKYKQAGGAAGIDNEHDDRFGMRIRKTIEALDETGANTDKLREHCWMPSIDDIMATVAELRKLANGIQK